MLPYSFLNGKRCRCKKTPRGEKFREYVLDQSDGLYEVTYAENKTRYVIRNTDAPSVLLELGFISNETEKRELVSEERQRNSAQAIADGIIRFLTEHLDE